MCDVFVSYASVFMCVVRWKSFRHRKANDCCIRVHKNRAVGRRKLDWVRYARHFQEYIERWWAQMEEAKKEEMNIGFRFAFIGFPLSFSSLLRFSLVDGRHEGARACALLPFTATQSHTWFDLLGNFRAFSCFWWKRHSAFVLNHINFSATQKKNSAFLFFRFHNC